MSETNCRGVIALGSRPCLSAASSASTALTEAAAARRRRRTAGAGSSAPDPDTRRQHPDRRASAIVPGSDPLAVPAAQHSSTRPRGGNASAHGHWTYGDRHRRPDRADRARAQEAARRGPLTAARACGSSRAPCRPRTNRTRRRSSGAWKPLRARPPSARSQPAQRPRRLNNVAAAHTPHTAWYEPATETAMPASSGPSQMPMPRETE